MPAPITPINEIKRTARLWRNAIDAGYPATASVRGELSALGVVHEKLGLSPTRNREAVRHRLNVAVALGFDAPGYDSDLSQADEADIRRKYGIKEVRPGASPAPRSPVGKPPHAVPPRDKATSDRETLDTVAAKIAATLRRKPLTTDELAEKLGVGPELARAAAQAAYDAGATVVERGGFWHLDTAPNLGIHRGQMTELLTDKDGWLEFAACGDQHLGSKYERLDCLNDYYDQIAHRGIATVLNAGNWIDGEAPFNKHDLSVHGMDNQMQYLAKHYPQRAGVTTLAITGADHEGWYARQSGVDVGRYAENVMRAAGREDWHDMGYMEAFIKLVNRQSGAHSKLSLMHPGGGSAYAMSYAPQKIVEGFDGGDKPAVLLIGHYHKSGYNLIRNVHTAQTGCFQDQTVFMRQKKLSAHLGGCFMRVHVDPHTGAVDECSYTFRNYFVRDYYNGRWSQHGAVNLTKRVK